MHEQLTLNIEKLYRVGRLKRLEVGGGNDGNYRHSSRALWQARDDAYDRFEKLAQEHGRTAKQLMLEAMEIYFQEAQRLKDEKN